MFEWDGQSAFAVKTNLYASWAPFYEVGQLAFSDTLETLVHLCGVHLSLHTPQATIASVPYPLQFLHVVAILQL